MTCTICNNNPGKLCTLAFPEDDEPIRLEMCEDCFADFRADGAVEIVRGNS